MRPFPPLVPFPPFAAALIAAAAAPALAQQSVSIDLAGVQIRNATNQSRSSAPQTLAPAVRYRYDISGSVRGQPFLSPLYLFFPNPVPLAQALETFAPGTSENLRGTVANPGGLHPFALSNLMFEGESVVAGVTVTFAATISAGIDAANTGFFAVENVTITPSSIGYLQFSTGSVVITRIPCPANFSDGGAPGPINSSDISAFLTAWLSDVTGGPADADYNLDTVTNSSDISAFLTDWLLTVTNGCPQ